MTEGTQSIEYRLVFPICCAWLLINEALRFRTIIKYVLQRHGTNNCGRICWDKGWEWQERVRFGWTCPLNIRFRRGLFHMHGLGVEARMALFHWDKGTDAGPAMAIGHSGAGAGRYRMLGAAMAIGLSGADAGMYWILGAAMSRSCSGAGSGRYYRMLGAAWSQSTFRSMRAG